MKYSAFKITSILLLSTLFFTACGKPTSTSNTSSKNITTTNKKSASTTAKTSAKGLTKKEATKIMGTFEDGAGASLRLGNDGSYNLVRNGKISSGIFRIAGVYQNQLILRFTNLTAATPELETYLTATVIPEHTLQLEKLGEFKPVGTTTAAPEAVFSNRYLTASPKSAFGKLVGSWSNRNTSDQPNVTINFNPDGTFAKYSADSNQLTTGTFKLQQKGKKYLITYLADGQKSETLTYQFSTQNQKLILITADDTVETTYTKNLLD